MADKTKPSCGYVNCTCGTCFDTAVCSRPLGEKHAPEHHLCLACEEAGCDPSGDVDCLRTDNDDNGEED